MTKKLTTEEFIQKARTEHGDTYGYDNVEYINMLTKVNITCKICQKDFLQRPNDHLQSKGCPTCANHKRATRMHITTEEFIQKARVEHGDTYGYDNVNYVNNKTKVNITCKTCQKDFLQRPSDHLDGSGCPTCANHMQIHMEMTQGRIIYERLTTEEFIQKARTKHGDKYRYDNVKYVNSKTKVDITCKICKDDFPQRPDDHLYGKGCPTCAYRKRGRKQEQMTKAEFIQKARAKHGYTYGYDNVEYINNKTKVNITCLECQEDFLQRPNKHIDGNGCPTCVIKKNAKNKMMMEAEFIQKARAKHGDTYGYDNVEYISNRTKVNITCLECQEDFPQTPRIHLQGSGCPTCVNKTEKIICDVLQSVLDTLKVKQIGHSVTEDIGRMDIVVLNQNTDIVCFIEVDGGQHFEFIEFFTISVEDIQNSDLEKHKRAKMKGYRTIRIDQEWIWNSHKKGDNSWVECLKKTILKLEQNIEPDIKEMFLSNKVDKYYSHPCYQYEKDIENLYKDVEQLYVQ